MAKLVCVVSRDSRSDPELDRKIELLSRRLTPDNISPHPSVVINENGLALAVLNPTGALRTHRSSVCLGFMTDPPTEWWRPGADVPDGTYVLFRSILVITESEFLSSRQPLPSHSSQGLRAPFLWPSAPSPGTLREV